MSRPRREHGNVVGCMMGRHPAAPASEVHWPMGPKRWPIRPGGAGAAGGVGGDGGAGADPGGAGGGGGQLKANLEGGVWLIGWAGGLDHFSWVRFDFTNATQGSIELLTPDQLSFTPYFPCEGMGLFSIDEAASEALLQLPATCAQTTTIGFESFSPAGGPPSAILTAAIQDQSTAQAISGYKYASSQCDAAFTMCSDPYQ